MTASNPQLIDLVILAAVFFSFLLGLWTGFVWQVAGMVSVAAGGAAAWFLTEPVAAFVRPWAGSDAAATVSARVGLFCLVAILVRLAAMLAKAALDKMKLGTFDRVLGGFLGGAKAFCICVILLGLLSQTQGKLREGISASVIGGLTVAGADWVAGKADTERLRRAMAEAISRLQTLAQTGKLPALPPYDASPSRFSQDREAGER